MRLESAEAAETHAEEGVEQAADQEAEPGQQLELKADLEAEHGTGAETVVAQRSSAAPAAAAAAAIAKATTAAAPAIESAGAFVGAGVGAEAESPAAALVLEAVHVAAKMVDAFPHVHNDLAEALAFQLQRSLGEFTPLAIQIFSRPCTNCT